MFVSLDVLPAVLLLSLQFFVATSSGSIKLKTQMKIAQCRANCLDQFHQNTEPRKSYNESPDCKMCWETCELLHRNFDVWGSMCGASDICFLGCQKACAFHLEGSKNNFVSHSAQIWSFPHTVRVKIESKTDYINFTWSVPVSSKPYNPGHVIYVVMMREDLRKSWEVLDQTLKTTAQIKAGWLNRVSEVKIVAMTSNGVLAEQLIPYSSNHEKLKARDEAETVLKSTLSILRVNEKGVDAWRPTLLSLDYNPNLLGVEAIVTWPALRPIGAIKYEVTWKVLDSSVEITGHLYTAENVVKLTLWPEALYSVQVKCYAESKDGESVSEDIVVDTHDVISRATSNLQESSGCSRVELIIGCAAGVSLILSLLMACSMCKNSCLTKRRSRPIQKISALHRKRSEEPRAYSQKRLSSLEGRTSPESSKEMSSHVISIGAGPLSAAGEFRKDIIKEKGFPPSVFTFGLSNLDNSSSKSRMSNV
ncbi:uncharacterized protein LOC106469831 isoform X1 [Limulus polyphemus]|uniref:Uncharacterized protein LOC106469831 isoform X1 n=1 Tax=Limulus polyphemus TaxID=6850 RepID=A0ABM1TGM1_LIMPO|nr:uncharacterized protein LOC106469831 isoform X1 [Limulus polyphemus]